MTDPIYCYVLPERRAKTEAIMTAFARGCGGTVVTDAKFRNDGIAVVWGQIWASAAIMRQCAAQRVPFYQIDNGYFLAARGRLNAGYYRVTKNALTQNWVWRGVKPDRWEKLGLEMKPWRGYGKDILLAVPGLNFGHYMGLDLEKWSHQTFARLQRLTKRRVLVRPKRFDIPLAEELKACFALVTHASNAAVEAVLEGVPVFCDPMCAAAPVGCTDLNRLEQPVYPRREEWAWSLAYGQFSLREMADGTAWKILNANPGPPR